MATAAPPGRAQRRVCLRPLHASHPARGVRMAAMHWPWALADGSQHALSDCRGQEIASLGCAGQAGMAPSPPRAGADSRESDEETLFPSRPSLLPDELKGVLLLPSEADSESTASPDDLVAGMVPVCTSHDESQHTSVAPASRSGSYCWDVSMAYREIPADVKGHPSQVFGIGMPTMPMGLFAGCIAQRVEKAEHMDFLEVEGQSPLATVSAEWSGRLVQAGVLCPYAPVLFDPGNPGGAVVWGPARGAIVVAERGDASFEEIALNAEQAAPPRVPAAMVPRCAQLCCGGGKALRATIVRH